MVWGKHNCAVLLMDQTGVLEAGELARIFEGWTVLVERVDTLLDGRPLACLLTRK